MNLKPFVNDHKLWESFTALLDKKISDCHKTMEQATDTVCLFQKQGEIIALRRLKNLRDEVNNG